MYQAEFTRLYDKLYRYAVSLAKRRVGDRLWEDVADKALEDVVVYWTGAKDGYDIEMAKEIIRNSVHRWSRESEKLTEIDGIYTT